MQAAPDMDPLVAVAYGDFKHELANTRRMIAAVPNDKLDWKPHAKSQTMGSLASHIVQMAGWGDLIVRDSGLDFSNYTGPSGKHESTTQMLEELDRSTAHMLELLTQITPAQLQETWTLSHNGHVLMAAPRAGVLRGLYMSHIIHHRAQLSIYLRMLDVPMPGMYGPSADEQ